MASMHVSEYPDPATIEGALEMIEKAYEFENTYENNPRIENVLKFERAYIDPDGNESATQYVYPAQVNWALEDTKYDPLAYRSQILLVNQNTGTAFTSFNVTDAFAFMPSY